MFFFSFSFGRLKQYSWRHYERRHQTNQRNIVQYRLRQVQQLKWQRESLAVLLQGQWDEAIANASGNASGNANVNANSAANAAANAIAKGKIWDSLGSKKSLLEQIKVTHKILTHQIVGEFELFSLTC